MIERVEITIEYPEEMEGILRLETLECFNSKDERIEGIIDLINNEEFHSEEEVINFVTRKLGISPDIIDVV